MAVWQYLLLILAVLGGGGLAIASYDRGRGRVEKFLPLLLSFSGAYLLSIAAMELMPTVFRDPGLHTGIWIIAGFIIQLLLESLSQGVEHGHVHAHEQGSISFALSIMFGLGVHAFLEGLPLGTVSGEIIHGHAHAHSDGSHLLWGIVIHKIPAAFALAVLLLSSQFSRTFVLSCLLTFALLSPLGALVGEIISIDPLWTNRILALVIGSFLHISTTIIFEADQGRRHGISLRKFLVVLLGVAVAVFTAH